MRTALVGRERQRTELNRLIADAQSGKGALALIGGEAGAGKTVLTVWTLEAGAAQQAQSVISRCAGPGETPLYGPWRQVASQLPDLPWPKPLRAPVDAAQTFQAPVQRQPLADAVAAALREAGRPLVVALEDIQWADAASLDLLCDLVAHLPRLPLLLIATYRTTEAEALQVVLPQLVHHGCVRLTLPRFTPDEVRAMTDLTLPGHPGAAVMARYLFMRTAGHPLFVSELLAMVRSGGTPDGKLPETAQQVIEQQLNRLRSPQLEVLQAAAVIGERFDYNLLVLVADMPEEDVIAALEAALAVHVIRTEDDAGERFTFDHALVREVVLGRVIGPRRRRWHLRVAEALLPSVGSGTSGSPNLELLALHLERAGDLRAVTYLLLAGDHALRMGARSQAAARYEQVLSLLTALGPQAGEGGARRAEALLKLAFATQGGPAQRYCAEALEIAVAADNVAVAVWARHLQAMWHAEEGHPGALGELKAVQAAQAGLLSHGQYQRLEADLFGETLAYPRVNGSLALALTKAGCAAEAEAVLRDMQARIRPGDRRTPVLRVQWWMTSLMGRWDDALELGQRLIDTLQAENDQRAAFAVASNRLYHVLLCRGDDPTTVDAVADQVLRLAERVAAVSGYDPLHDGHPPLGWYSYLRGDWDTARKHLLGYLERHPEDADPGVRGFAVALQMAQGDTAGARATLLAVPPLHPGEDPGLHMVQISAYLMRADLCLSEGRVSDAQAWLEAAARYQARRGGTAFRASARLTWARYYQAVGHLETASAEVKAALAEADSPRECRALIAAHRMAGELAVGPDRAAEASVHLRAAEDLAVRCTFPYEVALTQLIRAEVLPSMRTDLKPAAATFARLGAAPALARAQALLGAGGASAAQEPARHAAPSAIAGVHGLSMREMEVVRWVAQGLTDKEVAAQLYISPRTVDGHLRRIFTKSGVRSRTAVVAWATRNGWI